MAVYTRITEQELAAFLQSYPLPPVTSFDGISEGISNSNYLLHTAEQRYILTIFEERVEAEALPFFFALMDHLAAHHTPCAAPIHMHSGEVLGTIKDRPAAILQFLEGKSPRTIRNAHCTEVGHHLAKMHLATQDFSKQRTNTESIHSLRPTYQQLHDRIDTVKAALTEELDHAFDHLTTHWPTDLPKGAIHADLFPDNVLFTEQSLTAILDFYLACTDFYAYDLAVTLNAWCFEHETEFNITKAGCLLKAYEKVRPLSSAERQALPILAAGAALSVVITRLYDALNPKEDALVTPKDPLEYVAKLRFHLQIKSLAEYGVA